MRNLKKVLGLVLCLAMMLSIMVVGAGAAFADQSDIDTKHTEAVDMCNALNIITGFENGKFMPKDNVTREQMAKMICVLDNGGKEPQLSTGNTFSDVAADRWSNKYIEACASRGVVVGIGGGKFSPAGKVTATQAAKMLLVELGYDDGIQQYSGADWATKVNVDATKKGYYEDLEDIDVNAPLTREHAAQMIWNALQATEIEYKNTLTTDANGNLTAASQPQDKTHSERGTDVFSSLLWDKYKGDVKEGRLVKFGYDSNKKEWTYQVNGSDIPLVKSTQNYTDLLGQKVKVAYDTSGSAAIKDAYGIFVTDSQVILEGQFGSLPKMTNPADTSFKMDGVTYKVEGTLASTNVYQFCPSFGEFYAGRTLYKTAGQEVKPNQADASNITTWDAQKFSAIDYDGNGKIDFLMVVPFEVAKVNYLSSTQFSLDKFLTSKTDLEDVNYYDGMARSDYVVYTDAWNTADDTAVLTKADLVSGQISATDSPDAQIDGTWYTFDASYADTSNACKAGNTLKDAVVVNNYIFDVDKIDHTNIEDFAVVVALQGSGANTVNGNQAKLLFSDGQKTIVDTDKNYFADTTVNVGTLVTYSKNSDGEYILEPVTYTGAATNPDTDYGYELQEKFTYADKISNNSSKVGYLNSALVNDDAVIYVQYGGTAKDTDNHTLTYQNGKWYNGSTMVPASDVTISDFSYKMITGAQLKAISKDDISEAATAQINSLVLGSKNGNVKNVEMAYISLGASKVNDADTYYAYVTGANIVKNDDNAQVLKLSVWTKDGADGTTSLEYASASVTGDPGKTVAAGDVIEYKLNSDGKISEVMHKWDADSTTLSSSTAVPSDNHVGGTVAISALDPTFQFSVDGAQTGIWTRAAMNAPAGKYFETDKDTAYIYIENDDHSGVDPVDILTADKDGDIMLKNAFVVFDNSDGTILAVVYDTDNRITEGTVSRPVVSVTGPSDIAAVTDQNGAYEFKVTPDTIYQGNTISVNITCKSIDTANSKETVTVTYGTATETVEFTGAGQKTVEFTAQASGAITGTVAGTPVTPVTPAP
jgi:hypothetical protein